MSGPVPMSPSTAPDSTVSQGSAASAPAGMVSGNDGAVHAGTTPVYHMGDPLQGSGDPWASTTPWLSFSPGVSSAALPSTPIGLPSQSSPGGSGQSGNTATFGRVATLPHLGCHQGFWILDQHRHPLQQ